MGKKIYAIATVVILIVVGIGGYMYYKRTPTYTLSLIRDSVQKHDYETFSKHVDTKNLLSTAFDDIVTHTMGDLQEQKGLNAMAAGLVNLMKPSIVDALQNKIEQAVKGGDSKPADNAQSANKNINTEKAANNMQEKLHFDRTKFKDVAYTNDNGDGFSIVGITLTDEFLSKDFILELKMKQLDDGTWQILNIYNLNDYLTEIEQAEKDKLAEINKPVQDQLDAQVAFSDVRPTIIARDSWGISIDLVIAANLSITSEKQIKAIEGEHTLTKDGMYSWTRPFRIEDVANSITITYSLNPFIPEDKTLVNAGIDGATISTKITGIEYQDGSTLKLKTSLLDN